MRNTPGSVFRFRLARKLSVHPHLTWSSLLKTCFSLRPELSAVASARAAMDYNLASLYAYERFLNSKTDAADIIPGLRPVLVRYFSLLGSAYHFTYEDNIGS